MSINTIIPRMSEIYYQSEVSDPDIMYFHWSMKENDATQFLNVEYKEFEDLLSKGNFELKPHSIIP